MAHHPESTLPAERVIPLRTPTPNADMLLPKTVLIVETADLRGNVLARKQVEVVRPPGPVRQHEQLVQAVTAELPDARITSAADGVVRFICRGFTITSGYIDALETAAPSPAPDAAG